MLPIIGLLTIVSIAGGGRVELVGARGSNGKLNGAQTHQVCYIMWASYYDRGVEHLRQVKE